MPRSHSCQGCLATRVLTDFPILIYKFYRSRTEFVSRLGVYTEIEQTRSRILFYSLSLFFFFLEVILHFYVVQKARVVE